MPLGVTRYDPTPNPNAVKAVLDRAPGHPLPPPLQTRWFPSPEHAAGDDLARRLLAVPGVSAILLGSGWLTINKHPDAPWRSVKRGVERALREAPSP